MVSPQKKRKPSLDQILKEKNVTYNQLVLWAQDKYRRLYIITGFIIFILLTAVFVVQFIEIYRSDVMTQHVPLGLAIFFFACLELFIALPIFWVTTIKAIKHKSAFFESMVDGTIKKNFLILNLDYVTSPHRLLLFSEKKWNEIRSYPAK